MFKLVAPYKPTGDQPEAIAKLVEGIKRGDKEQTLLGVTGSGKTFTMAQYYLSRCKSQHWFWRTIRRWRRSCAASFASFSRRSAVEYFVSYYDYYQPEAYIASDGHLY